MYAKVDMLDELQRLQHGRRRMKLPREEVLNWALDIARAFVAEQERHDEVAILEHWYALPDTRSYPAH